jgi:hypothetical protein
MRKNARRGETAEDGRRKADSDFSVSAFQLSAFQRFRVAETEDGVLKAELSDEG